MELLYYIIHEGGTTTTMRSTIDFGIYLGVNNSSIAVLEGTAVKVIKNNVGDEVTPVAVYEKKAGNRIIKRVGKSAQLMINIDPQHVALAFKQMMGTKDWYFEFLSTGRKASPVDLSAAVLRELVAIAKLRTGGDVHAAVITVPAAFLNPMYEDTKEAGEKAGIRYVEVLEEPVAAALAYGLRADQTSTAIWLAYDLGGGTFDAALVKVEEGVFAVFDHEGIRNLGGKHLDAAIVEGFFLPDLPSKVKEKVIPWKSSSWWSLKFMAEEAKCQLSTEDSYTIDGTVDGHNFVYTLTRDQLDSLEAQIFSPTIEKCRELLSRNKFSSKHIEKVILIGGSTLSPHLRKMIEEGLGILVDFSIDPLTAVVRGAAIYASGRRIPPDEVLKKVREKGNGNKKKDVHVHLNYPPTTSEEDVLVAGSIESKTNGIIISSEWGVEIKRVSKTGEMEWSNKIPVSENGMFAMAGLPLKDYGENLFRLVVTDAQEWIVDTHDFCIIKSPESPLLLLPRGIGVADNNGNMVWLFEKGTALPAKKIIVLKTNKALIKGDKGGYLNISVVEGNEAKVYLNRVVGILRVKPDILPTTIPEESDMEVTITIDESRRIKVSAYFEEYDIEVFGEMLTDMNIDYESLREELLKITVFLGEIKILEEDKSDAWKVTDIERLISQAKDNPEYGQQAMEKILELRKKTDPILEKSNALIKYYSKSYSLKGL